MKKIKHPRTLKLKKNYIPKKQINEELEIYKNGIFNFFISKILEDIGNGIFKPKMERINIEKWRKIHCTNDSLNEEHLKTVNTRKPIIQAEISISKFEIIGKNLISLASKATELANKIIVTKLEENGIKGIVPSHGGILHLLYLNKKVTMKEVAEFINKTKPTVTVLVDKLISLDYVCKTKSDDDSRVTYLTLTQKGESLEPIFTQISDELNELVYKNLTIEESEQVSVILSKVIDSLNS